MKINSQRSCEEEYRQNRQASRRRLSLLTFVPIHSFFLRKYWLYILKKETLEEVGNFYRDNLQSKCTLLDSWKRKS